jgi:hypothetical protein
MRRVFAAAKEQRATKNARQRRQNELSGAPFGGTGDQPTRD